MLGSELQEQLDSVVTQSNATALKASGALRQLEARARAAAGARGAAARISRLQFAASRRLYADALQRHQDALALLRDHQYRLLQDQIRLSEWFSCYIERPARGAHYIHTYDCQSRLDEYCIKPVARWRMLARHYLAQAEICSHVVVIGQ